MPSPNSTTTVDILRHGRTRADDILRGRIDVPLSDTGYQQMKDRVAPYIDDSTVSGLIPWQQLITSPLQRCAHFAESFGERHGAPVAINPGFLEMDFGDWDGRPFDELRAQDPELFNNVWMQPHKYSPPNGETFQVFSERIKAAWEELLQQHRDKHILLICHGGVIRALLGMVLQTPLAALSRIDVPYACLSRIRVYRQEGQRHWPQLVFHNPG